jgi:hypothetical protein
MTRPLSRRTFLAAAGATATMVTLGACAGRTAAQGVGLSSAAVSEREDRRRRPGAAVREVALVAAPATVDLGGRTASTWVYGGVRCPGRCCGCGPVRCYGPASTTGCPPRPASTGTGSRCATTWTASPASPRSRSRRAPASPTSSPSPAPTSSTPTWACSWTAACTARCWSSCSTTGPTASAAPRPQPAGRRPRRRALPAVPGQRPPTRVAEVAGRSSPHRHPHRRLPGQAGHRRCAAGRHG